MENFCDIIFSDFKYGFMPKQCNSRLHLVFVDEAPFNSSIWNCLFVESNMNAPQILGRQHLLLILWVKVYSETN